MDNYSVACLGRGELTALLDDNKIGGDFSTYEIKVETQCGAPKMKDENLAETNIMNSVGIPNIDEILLQKKILALKDRPQTQKATWSCIANWNVWARVRNDDPPDDKIIPDFHACCALPVPILDDYLASFITEVKNRGGGDYQEASIRASVHGLQRYLNCYTSYFSKPSLLLIKNDQQFPKFQTAFKQRLEQCRFKKQRDHPKGISRKHEETLWDTGVFGVGSAKSLSDTIYFYFVKIFGIITSAALRHLKPEDIHFDTDQYGEYLEINKHAALNAYYEPVPQYNKALEIVAQGTLRHYADPSNPRTFYNLMKVYMEFVAIAPRDVNSGLFLTPDKDMKFKTASIGRNSLQRKFSEMMKNAGAEGTFTNQAIVQTYQPLLNGHGYNAKKATKISMEERLDICKILDPPTGTINTQSLDEIFSIDTQGQPFVHVVNELRGIPLYNILQKIKHCNAQFIQRSQNSQQIIQVLPMSIMPQEQLQNHQQQPQQQQQQPKPLMSYQIEHQMIGPFAVGQTVKQCDRVVEVPGTDENIQPVIDVHFKQEPLNFTIPNFQATKSCLCPSIPIQTEATVGLDGLGDRVRVPFADRTNQIKPIMPKRKQEICGKVLKPVKLQKIAPATIPEQLEEARIEYAVTSDIERKLIKQEIQVSDGNRHTFYFSGTNKLGKTANDMDLNLGEYLPDGCTIKPKDIDIKRLVMADGGKLVFNVKYSVPK